MINQFSLSNTVNSIPFSTFQSFGQFNLTSSSSSSSNSSSSSSSNSPNSSNLTNSSFDNLTNLDRLIRDELNDVNLCNRICARRESIVNVGRFLNQRSYGNRTPTISSDYGLRHLITNNLLKENEINLGQIDKIYSSCWLNDEFVLVGSKCNKVSARLIDHFPLQSIQSKIKS